MWTIVSVLRILSVQVTALDTGISINMFYGDPGENVFISKMFKEPYKEHFHYWFLNIIEQNKDQQSFTKILSRLSEVVRHFFIKQWHEVPTEEQVSLNFFMIQFNKLTFINLIILGVFSCDFGQRLPSD